MSLRSLVEEIFPWWSTAAPSTTAFMACQLLRYPSEDLLAKKNGFVLGMPALSLVFFKVSIVSLASSVTNMGTFLFFFSWHFDEFYSFNKTQFQTLKAIQNFFVITFLPLGSVLIWFQEKTWNFSTSSLVKQYESGHRDLCQFSPCCISWTGHFSPRKGMFQKPVCLLRFGTLRPNLS